MKNKMTRLISVLLVLAMVAAVFTACDPAAAGPTEPPHVDYAAEVRASVLNTNAWNSTR